MSFLCVRQIEILFADPHSHWTEQQKVLINTNLQNATFSLSNSKFFDIKKKLSNLYACFNIEEQDTHGC